MGMIFKTVVALLIGWGVLTAVQHAWMAAMQQQIEQVSQTPSFAVGQPVGPFDPNKVAESFKGPQIDTTAAANAGFQSQFREMELRNRAAQMGAPQIANGIPTMPGQGAPLQFGIPGAPHR